MMNGPNLPSSSPILSFLLIVVMGAMLITTSKWFMVDIPEDKKELDEESQKMVGRWEQPVQDRIIDMDLEQDGDCRYAFRDSDRLNIHGTWKVEEGRLVLHIERVNGGSTFAVGDNVTLGPVVSVDSRTMILGNDESKAIFRRRR
ncbi:MAG TPA: lipocalin family protein [Tepidisphaeraceae bacterium]|jgi:hypothetical protein|nr:lipocalin family protein [Tepidisphaeraceae bacterium]